MKNKKRIIEIEVNDEYIVGSGVVIGAAVSHNDVVMKVRFNSSWAGLNIIATFRDALGENPISVVLTALSTLVTEETDGDHCVHKFSVPLNVKAYEGKISLSFTGYTVAAVASEDGEGVEYQETQAITSGTAYFNVLKSDAVLADDIFKTADVGQQLQNDVNTLGEMYGYLDDALTAIWEIQDSLGSTTITIADLGTLEANIEDLKDFLKYEHPGEQGKANMFNRIYPIGSIYMSVNSTSPASLFGGEWAQLTDGFLVSAGFFYEDNGGLVLVEAENRGGATSHKHGSGTLGATVTMSNSSILISSIQQKDGINHKPTAKINASTRETYTGETDYIVPVIGSTGDTTYLPPYYAVYMWKRTS